MEDTFFTFFLIFSNTHKIARNMSCPSFEIVEMVIFLESQPEAEFMTIKCPKQLTQLCAA